MAATMEQLAEVLQQHQDFLAAHGIRNMDVGLDPQGQLSLRLYDDPPTAEDKRAVRERLKAYPVWFMGGIQIELRHNMR